MHAEALRQVVQQIHRLRATAVYRYASFVKFEADVHNINMLPIKGPPW